VIFLTILALGGAAAFAAQRRAASLSSTTRPIVLRPRLEVVASEDEFAVSDGRYTLVWNPTATGRVGTVTDERTGHRIPVALPANCSLPDRPDPLGGSSILAPCDPVANAYSLFNIRTHTWHPIYADASALYQASQACAAGEDNCTVEPVAIGSDWIEFLVNCVEHCDSPGYGFQNISNGSVQTAVNGWRVGGHTIPNLNSSSLAEKLCAPLSVPHGPEGLPGTFIFAGRYGISTGEIGSGFAPASPALFLQRCGSRKRTWIDAAGLVLAANNRMVLWSDHGTDRQRGLLLPSLRAVVTVAPSEFAFPVLSSKRLFFDTPTRKVWATREAFPPPTG
jgi:hypothetical protein